MRGAKIWVELLGLQQAVVEDVEVDDDTCVLTVSVRVTKRASNRCGRCHRKCPRFDDGRGVRRWRALDSGAVRAYAQAAAPRVRCREHGVVIAAVPWARHDAGHTHSLDEQLAWLAVHTSRSATEPAMAQLMWVAWRTVGVIVKRVGAGAAAGVDRFARLRRIGSNEISYKRGHKNLTIRRRRGRSRQRPSGVGGTGAGQGDVWGFFDELDASGVSGEQRSELITHATADGANWITTVVAKRCPNAVRCADPFHVVQWAGKALDEERRASWNRAPGCGGA